VNPSRIFILRPVATTLLMVAILIVGAMAYLQLPLSALPEVAYPTIQVQTFYPGASPEVITSAITAPLEKQFGQMPGLSQMSSTSSAGASVITLQFNLSLAIDVAEQEVQAAISAGQNLLPQDLPAPPIYAKVNPADAPVLILGITSKTMALTDVEDLVDTRIAQKISQVKGHLALLHEFSNLKKQVKGLQEPIPQMPPYLERRWAWFVALAVERSVLCIFLNFFNDDLPLTADFTFGVMNCDRRIWRMVSK